MFEKYPLILWPPPSNEKISPLIFCYWKDKFCHLNEITHREFHRPSVSWDHRLTRLRSPELHRVVLQMCTAKHPGQCTYMLYNIYWTLYSITVSLNSHSFIQINSLIQINSFIQINYVTIHSEGRMNTL